MPLYEYACEACGHRVEIIQKFSDGPPDACPSCGKGPLQRQQSSPAIQFKGTGWYMTDYAAKGKGGDKSSEKGSEKSDGESKPAGKSDTASGDSSAASESKKTDAPAATPPAASKD